MAILLNDNGYKYVLNWNPSTTNLELLKYGLTTFDYPSGEYLKTLLETTVIGGSSFGSPIHGSWYDDANQYAPIAGTATHMLCNNGISNGITKITDKDFEVQYAGTYNIQFSVQLDQSSGAGHHIFIWFRKNGVDIPYSASEVAIQGTLAESIPSWNFIVDMNAGDYVNVMYSVTDTNVYLKSIAPTGVVPGVPSVIITMWKL
jgi:hypothetical protein